VSLIAFAIAAAKLPKSLGAHAPSDGGKAGDNSMKHMNSSNGGKAGDNPQTQINLDGGGKVGGNPLKQIDPGGIFLYIASTVTLMYGLTIFTQNVMSYILTAVGVTLLVVFVNTEKKADKPVIEIRLFRNVNFLLSNLAALFNYGATFALSYLLSIYLQIVKGYGADVSGLILITQPIVQAVLSPLAGRLSDRYSPYRIASLGMGLCTVSLVSFIFMGADSPLWRILASLALAGLGVALFSSPNTNAIMSCVKPGDYGVASSLTSTMRTMGQIISLAIITMIMNMALGATPIDEAAESGLIFSMHTGFMIFACICVVGVIISLQRKKRDA
ncbi:MAG: MFS transporter, partial [Clostridiales Family XIII bacterium]|jgi:predicted MFS family arabinose efflux permease|nr:MFS transporter [Clostridiales Family XIII bacterium]